MEHAPELSYGLAGSAKLLFSISYSVVCGAVIGVPPIPKSARIRYVEVLNDAISGVLLATAEVTLFQGCLTWPLFKLYSTHSLCMSPLLTFMSPLLPIFPPWLSTIPAAVQLLPERGYLLAMSLPLIHLALMDSEDSKILKPG
ncbi:hypothetical protein U1Q18_015585 [Sarracenia purpurea var. burkii]